jgi:hypothetical protein
LFSPDGRWLVVSTPSGCFVWDVESGHRVRRIKGVPNPVDFSFDAAGTELLMRNEQAQFARIAIPSGELIAKFTSKFGLRHDGGCCLTPDGERVATWGCGPVFLLLDARTGDVTFQRPMELNTFGGHVYWSQPTGSLLVTLRETSSHREYARGADRLFRWQWPVEVNEPERLTGSRGDLRIAPAAAGKLLVLYSRVSPVAAMPPVYRIELIDVATFECIATQDSDVGAQTWQVSASYDVSRIAASGSPSLLCFECATWTRQVLHVDRVRATFSPTADLVALAGLDGTVVPSAQLASLAPALGARADLERLKQRGYARVTTLPEKRLPPRVMVFEAENGWWLGAEHAVGRLYRPCGALEHVVAGATPASLGGAVCRLAQTAPPSAPDVQGGGTEARRGLLGGRIGAPTPPASRLVLVTFAADLIELWATRTEADGSFSYTWWPVAALPPDADAAILGAAILEMFDACVVARPRRSAASRPALPR